VVDPKDDTLVCAGSQTTLPHLEWRYARVNDRCEADNVLLRTHTFEGSTGSTAVGYAVLKSIHLLGIVVWVGGMFFVLACLRPAAAALEPGVRVALMRDALGRFLQIVMVAAGLVLLSGVWMIATASRVSIDAGIGFNMPIDWLVMVTLGVVMIAIYGYIRFAVFRQLGRAAAAREWPAAGAALGRIRVLVIVNIVLAVIIIVVTRLGAAG
jgi:uncharacterized membrane protein